MDFLTQRPPGQSVPQARTAIAEESEAQGSKLRQALKEVGRSLEEMLSDKVEVSEAKALGQDME